jgi:hypothetical protein
MGRYKVNIKLLVFIIILQKRKTSLKQNLLICRKPQLENRAYYYWSKYYPRKKKTENATRMSTLQQDLKHLRNEVL